MVIANIAIGRALGTITTWLSVSVDLTGSGSADNWWTVSARFVSLGDSYFHLVTSTGVSKSMDGYPGTAARSFNAVAFGSII